MHTKDEDIFIKRILELSKISYERNITTYSDFINLNELNLLNQINKNTLYSFYTLSGGYNLAQRQMISFIPDAVSYDINYPIIALKITLESGKFSEKLTHRDYLGSILGLGIHRNKIGDILVYPKYSIVFVHEKIADFLCDNLTKVKHTYVSVCVSNDNFDNYEPEFEIISGSVSSLRLDTMMALVMKESRSKLIRHIEDGKVFVNGKLITTNACKLNESDIISIRGFGKFQFYSLLNITKKGKYYIELKKYIN